MKPGWTRQPIAALARHNLGKMLDQAKNRGDMKPYLRNLNVRWFDFDLTDVLQMRFEAHEVERYTVRKGDLVICEGGYPGRAAVWNEDEPVYFQKALHRVRFYEPAYAQWCLYYLLYEDAAGKLKLHFNGTGIQHFTGETLARFEIPAPSASEVTRIVAILDEAFEAIATAKANTQKNLQNARELFDNFMHTLLSMTGPDWTERTLQEVCKISSKLVDPREPEYIDMSHVGAGNIESRSGELVHVLTAREEQLISGKFLFDDSAVLYSKIRPYLMKVVRPAFSGLCSADIYPLVPKSGRIDRDYLYYLLLSRSFTEYAIKGSARAGMPKVNREHLFAYRTSLPPIEVQSRHAGRLDALTFATQRLTEICDVRLAALDELKQSLLHQAFTGAL